MAANGTSVEFRMPQEPLPVPAMDEIRPVPLISADNQSFVVIKSAADLEELMDDNDVSDVSLLQEHKKLLHDELAQFDLCSTYPQPSLDKTEFPAVSIKTDGSPKASLKGLDPSNKDMNQSVLPNMPQICKKVEDADHEQRTISIVSFAPSDFGSEEIQAKVTQLIEENMHLKDTILQNNLSMKMQYDRIVAWQKDVERVHEAHKEKFRDAKKCIETLKQENAILKQENDNLHGSLQQQRIEHDKTKRLLTETSENNLKEFELDMANNKIKELEAAFEKLTIQNQKDLASESAKFKAMEEKLLRYEKELEIAYKQIRDFEKGKDGEQERVESEKIKLVEEKLLLSEMANDRANKELSSLRTQLARNVQVSDDATKLQLALDQAIAERNILAADLESRNATVVDINMRCSKLEQTLREANDAVREHEEAAKCLKEKEEQAKIEAWMTKQKMSELEQSYQLLQQSKQQHVPDFNQGELAYIRQQLMQSQKALTESEHNRAVAVAKIEVLNNANEDLRKQLEAKQQDDGDLFALRTQLEVYKTDFEAEREAKDEVKRDKNKIAEDLQHLNRRNQQMQEEIELLREQIQQYGSIPRAHPQASAPSGTNQYVYKCPKCNFGFRTLNAVENHVVRCIELDDALP